MPGPSASPQRRRTNTPTNVPAPVTAAGAPALPKTYTRFDGFNEHRIKFLAASRDWYAAWVERGEASGFGATDWLFLRDVVAPMFDGVKRGGSMDRARELRLQLAVLEKLAQDRAAAMTVDEAADANDDGGLAEVVELLSRGA